jgi:hypothetical protein
VLTTSFAYRKSPAAIKEKPAAAKASEPAPPPPKLKSKEAAPASKVVDKVAEKEKAAPATVDVRPRFCWDRSTRKAGGQRVERGRGEGGGPETYTHKEEAGGEDFAYFNEGFPPLNMHLAVAVDF